MALEPAAVVRDGRRRRAAAPIAPETAELVRRPAHRDRGAQACPRGSPPGDPDRSRRLREDQARPRARLQSALQDRKSTRLNSTHTVISYAVFCLKKKILSLLSAALGRLRVLAVRRHN